MARVDLKADRKAGTLRVPGAFLEEDRDPLHVAGELALELKAMADWLGLDETSIGQRGDLTAALRKAL